MNGNNEVRARISERFACDIAVMACTTLETRAARIVDLSTHGAKVHSEEPYEPGTLVHLDLEGDLVWGTVQWSEIDRMGIKFSAPLASGHRLARLMEDMRRRSVLRQTIVGAAPVRGFGRRAA